MIIIIIVLVVSICVLHAIHSIECRLFENQVLALKQIYLFSLRVQEGEDISAEVDKYYSLIPMTSSQKTKLLGFEFMMLQTQLTQLKQNAQNPIPNKGL